MKKITFTLLSIILLTSFSHGQTVNTGWIDLSTGNTPSSLDYRAKIEINSTIVTLTLIGPSDRWLGFGFDATFMTAGRDVVIFDGTNLTDRTFVGLGNRPTLDGDNNNDGIDDLFPAEQGWTIISNDIVSGARTLVATRDATGGAGDHKFTTSDTSLNIAWARKDSTLSPPFELEHHGTGARGMTIANFHPLSLNDHNINTFSISPNPGKSKLNLKLSRLSSTVNLEVFDVLGKEIYSNRLTNATTSVDVSKWNSGVYLVRVSTDSGVQTKRFVKQ